ncbi:MAG TPA: zinc-binding alcohol dehydrogenase family protein [Dehalococcoidia bacterium]|nr:zinc-binding alcohol dehydrogenase family protein [Dehalococcoidia bacterium]
MKAAVYYETGAPDVFKYEDVPDPKCGAMQVLIEVQVVSIEGGDVGNRAGGDMAGKPHIVGYQCAGLVREAGSSVTDRKVGDRVVAIMQYGSHAGLVVANPLQTWLIPDGMDMQQAACIPIPFGTAHDCLFEFGRLQAGETVLIQAGAGGVGLAAIQLAKRAGATVLSTASSDERLERLKEFGLDHGINYRATPNWIPEAMRLGGGRGVDLVVDSVGTTLEGSIAAAGYRGRVVTVGNAGRAESRMIDVQTLSAMNKSLTGVFFGAEMIMRPERARALVEKMIGDVAKGELRVVIDRTYPLSEAAAAHAYIESRQAFGRVLLIP